MRHKALFITFTICLIFVIVCCSEVLAGNSFRKWFGAQESALIHRRNSRNVSIVRRGIGYVLKRDVGLEDEDEIVTDIDSSATLVTENGSLFYLDENAAVTVGECSNDTICLTMKMAACISFSGNGTQYIGIIDCRCNGDSGKQLNLFGGSI
jgi:hypothetical protein